MTDKQHNLIAALIRERNLNSLRNEQQEYLRKIMFEGVRPDAQIASRIISALLALPRVGETATPTVEAPAADVAAGRYAIVDPDGRVRFFVVDRPTEGRWAGRTFVSEQASDEKYPVRGPRRSEVLAAISVDPEDALRRYGVELGRCGVCGRTLTDETSRAAGIGPDCADRFGIDRSPYRARAESEAADRVRGEQTTAPAAGVGADLSVDDTGEGSDTSPAPAAPQTRSYEQLRAAAGRQDPAKALGWRERRAAVDEQQDAADRRADRPSSQNREYPGEDIFGAPLA